jgi:hypothetical protein
MECCFLIKTLLMIGITRIMPDELVFDDDDALEMAVLLPIVNLPRQKRRAA